MEAIQRLVLAAVALAMATPGVPAADLTSAQAKAIAVEAYVYTYPLVMMDMTRRVMTNVPPGVKPGLGPANAFHHFRTYPPADFREVVRPNFDTLYSSAWLDLTKEPMVVSVPDAGGRYYLVPLMDMWTDAYAVPGKRTSGTAAAAYAIVPPGWNGALPAGLERIDSPTVYNWVIGRTQTNGPADYAAVNKFQDGFKVTPLSQWGKPAVPPAPFVPDPAVDMKKTPPSQVDGMTGDKYFAYAAELMKLHKPHATDWSTVARMKRLGIVPGRSFDIGKGRPRRPPGPARRAVRRAEADQGHDADHRQGRERLADAHRHDGRVRQLLPQASGHRGDRPGCHQVDDAIYPMNVADADGKPMDGNNDYVLHFSKAELPPVDAFWSITMYDGDGYQAANPLNRFAIGDRDALKYNADGSLDIYMQNASPGADKESNWLPAPKGPLGITMRLYAPKPEVADGRWVPPAIKRVK